jgi:hypothetical protein
MPYRAALLLLPFVALAQAPKPADSAEPTAAEKAPAKPVAAKPVPAKPAPKKVDQALRDRAAAFMKYQIAGNYRKALDFVAADTQDYYFTSPKMKMFTFKIDEIQYSDKFTQASVIATVKKTRIGAIPIDIIVSQTDLWKIENGKWMWYYKPPPNPLLELSGQTVPKDPKAIAAAASSIKSSTSVNKQSVTFTLGQAGMDEVVFHNGNQGTVNLVSDIFGNPDEFKVEPVTAAVPANQDFKVKVTYTPQPGPRIPAKVRLTVQPFQQELLVPVIFAPDTSTQPPDNKN